VTAQKQKARHNRTIILSKKEEKHYRQKLHQLKGPATEGEIVNKTINQDLLKILPWLPEGCVDLLFLDPPYNLDKEFNRTIFKQRTTEGYLQWLETWFPILLPTLKPTASVYFCGEWRSTTAIHLLLEKYLVVRNRITWEREKGRGALTNWKNCSEDIWFCTVGKEYTFNVDAVKLKRRVIAPYRTNSGKPKDWHETEVGNFRLTSPSNLWTDLTVPFWSMPENTVHPTQKPEKLLAKVILASTNPGDLVLDPFLGSGTTSVVAKKLDRRYLGIELDRHYCCLAEKRLALAEEDNSIQGYAEGVFWERNTLDLQRALENANKRKDVRASGDMK